MSPPPDPDSAPLPNSLRREARRARDTVGLGGIHERALRVITIPAALLSVLLVARRVVPFWGVAELVAVIAAALLVIVGVLLVRARLRARRAPHLERSVRCPRCGDVVVREGATSSGLGPWSLSQPRPRSAGASRRSCSACGAVLLRAHGLTIHAHRDRAVRAARWRLAARRMGFGRARGLGPSAWLAGAVLAILGLAQLTSLTAAEPPPPPLFRMSSGGADRASAQPFSLRSPALARSDLGSVRAPGAARRGAEVLAPARATDEDLSFGVVIDVAGHLAHVVFADGRERWCPPAELYAADLFAHETVELTAEDEPAARPIELAGVVGVALRYTTPEGPRWTTKSRVRVPRAAPEASDSLPASRPIASVVWESADGLCRPAIVVDSTPTRVHVVAYDGREAWVERPEDALISPGEWVTDRAGTRHLVARRVGWALELVDASGRGRWSTLAMVRSGG